MLLIAHSWVGSHVFLEEVIGGDGLRLRRRARLRGKFVFVEQPTEPVAAAETIQRQLLCPDPFADRRRLLKRRLLGERAVRPLEVVGR